MSTNKWMLPGLLFCLLFGPVFSDAREWQGNYANPNNTTVSRTEVRLHDCDDKGCHLYYTYNGWHAYTYSTYRPTEGNIPGEPLQIRDGQGTHRF